MEIPHHPSISIVIVCHGHSPIKKAHCLSTAGLFISLDNYYDIYTAERIVQKVADVA